MKIRISETFLSVQGEGLRTGVLSVWQRHFGCSLSCPGFFQADPTDVSTYVDPLGGVDPKQYKTLADIPVMKVGCDTLYAIDPRFKHCTTDYQSAADLNDVLYGMLPDGKWMHPDTGQTYDWCITGGEPMMHQKAIIEQYEDMYSRDAFPYDVQIETNCTRAMSDNLVELIKDTTAGRPLGATKWWMSCSPKLFHVSGESADRAWHPEIIKQYWDVSPLGWMKFVVNTDPRSWDELDQRVADLRSRGVGYPVMVMGVGSTKESQEDSKVIGKIADMAIEKGYHFSGRLHCTIWGNTIGV